MKIYSIKAVRHSGKVETWLDHEEADLIQLAKDFESQWLWNRDIDPETIGIDQALEALLHDYASYDVVVIEE